MTKPKTKTEYNMDKLSFVGIIPARYASSRFPGKPLADIGGMTMIERVWRQACKALTNVCVATDDRRIFDAVQRFGGHAIMTSPMHKSGTDRCYEAYEKCGIAADVIINIQGDEPFIHEDQIREIMHCFDDPTAQIATLVRPFNPNDGFTTLADNTTPKVVFDTNMNALYFSRAVIPFVRGTDCSQWPEAADYYMHVGMYAYRADTLARITQLPQSSLEKAESLEQLRWLENGYRIKVGITHHESIGIDTPDDLKRAISMLNHNR